MSSFIVTSIGLYYFLPLLCLVPLCIGQGREGRVTVLDGKGEGRGRECGGVRRGSDGLLRSQGEKYVIVLVNGRGHGGVAMTGRCTTCQTFSLCGALCVVIFYLFIYLSIFIYLFIFLLFFFL